MTSGAQHQLVAFADLGRPATAGLGEAHRGLELVEVSDEIDVGVEGRTLVVQGLDELGEDTPLDFAFSELGFVITLGVTLLFGYVASRAPANKAIAITVREAIAYE